MGDFADWTSEEKDRVVAFFEWLLEQDMKQNPEKYPKNDKLPSKAKTVE